MHGKRGQNEWYVFEYQGASAKAPPCPGSTLQTLLPQQSSSSAREAEDHWVLMEDRRRRRIAFESLAKEMLRYLDISDDVKVGITELQERLEVPVHIGISIQQVAQQAIIENDQKMFEVFWQEEEEICIASCAAETLSRLGKKMSRHKSGNTDADQKTRNIPECDRKQAQSARQSE